MSKIRQRTTIVIPNSIEAEFHDKIKLNRDFVSFPPISHARQERFSIPIDELAPKWKSVTSDCTAFRIQYSSAANFDRSIFGDFSQAGLSLNVIPKVESEVEKHGFQKRLQNAAQFFGDATDLAITKDSFILSPTAAKFVSLKANATQLSNAVSELISDKLEPGWKHMQIDFNAAEEPELVLEIYWDNFNVLDHHEAKGAFKKEIGVFSIDEKLTNIENVGLNGVRFLFSETTISAKQTAFQFTPRHRFIPTLSFDSLLCSDGLHRTLSLNFDNSTEVQPPFVIDTEQENRNSDICKLYSVWNINKDVFIDKYQLRDDKFIGKGIDLLGLFGDSNLEAPSYMMRNWGTEALLELDINAATSFEIPIHLRYQNVTKNGYFETELQHPLLFWACDLALHISILEEAGSIEGAKNRYQSQISEVESALQVLSKSPFHKKFLDYESYFDDNTVFYHIQRKGPEKLELTVPVAESAHSAEVEWYTVSIISMSLAYLIMKLFK